ncbi:alkaline phosphatase family protein [Sphingomonas sp. Mn802worker]|uniref:alkaline phosphatase family protein n=1 Tax=Sphingomonas sp. Mn802worker TaxID=629773 RepID=UPI00037FADCA|nr:ectonucleotide pyrophosphatase/phosphodiesterase [Sphingomonas sp. Mn802worker]
MLRPLLPLAALAAVGGCAYPYTPPALSPVTQPAPPATNAPYTVPASAPAVQEARAPVTILVSIDGFRPDYLQRGVTPNLSRLAADGVSADMRPSFPSKTFPNHWTLVTGVRPDRHGIVANSFIDPARPDQTFTMDSDDPFWWNAAEPIWVTAEKAGISTATMFWPGANVAWGGTLGSGAHPVVEGGTRPSDWQQFNQAVTGHQRVSAVIDWLRRPAATRPQLVTLYFDTVDSAGHSYGPADARTTQAVADVDARIGELVQGLAGLNQSANLVIVADHGMAGTSSTRVIALDRILPPADARVFETGPYASFYPAPGRDAAVRAALLTRHAHMTCWAKANIPARFHYGANVRIPPYLCLANDGPGGAWAIEKTAPTKPREGGNHGYDNEAADMRALFIANGPAFQHGKRIGDFDNVDVAPLLRDLLRLPAGVGLDGDDRPFRGVLRR